MLSTLIKKEGKQYNVSGWLMALFSLPFIVWQMGILFFSGTTMSLFGRTPIPLSEDDTVVVIAAGYVASIVFLCLFPRKAIIAERVLMPLALAATVLMLFPFSSSVITVLFYISAFCCVFSIGTMLSIAAHQLTVGTVWRDGIISMVGGGILVAVLQNDFVKVDFTVFTVFSVVFIAMQTVFYYLLPAKIEAVYISRENKREMPGILFIGIWLIIAFSAILICFASSFAESIKNGVSVIYLSAAAFAALLYVLRKKLGVRSVRVFGIFFALSVFGFALAHLSLIIPALRIIACVFLGLMVVLANLWLYFAAVSFGVYPLHYIGAIGAGTGLVLALVHSGLLELLRDNLPLLYGLYAVLSVALLLVYFFLEPYFSHAWNKARAEKPSERNAATLTKEAAAEIAAKEPLAGLSEQERILAGLILDGHSETSAARIMNITLNTQKGYRKNLYTKLDIHSKRELFEIMNK